MLRDFGLRALSDRESEIMLLAAEGMTDKEIAQRLGISAGSIRTYWDRMRHKLNAKSRGEIIARALRDAYTEAAHAARSAERWIKLLIDNARDYAIFSLEIDNTVASWNPGVERVLGYSEQEWIGQSGEIIFVPEDREKGVPEAEKFKAARDGQAPDQRWHLRKDGVRIWLDGMMIALKDEENVLVGFAKIVQDRTELKLALEELSERRRTAETPR